MLTEIEWWGGLLFIWGALCYWLVIRESDNKLSLEHLSTHSAFFFAGVVLALYFYPLASPALQYGYLASLGLALVALLLLMFWPVGDEEEEDLAPQANAEAEDEDDSGYDLLGQLIFCAPLVIASLLGAVKSYEVVQNLGWIG